MQKMVLLYLVLLFQEVQGQNQIFLNAEQLLKPAATKEISQIKLPWGNWGRKVVAVYKDGTKEAFEKKVIWGFSRPAKHELIRFSNGWTLKVIDTCIFVLYQTYSPRPIYYFSDDFGSKVFLFDKKNLLRELSTDKLIMAYRKSYLVKRLL